MTDYLNLTALAALGGSAAAIPWNSQVTVVGILVAFIMMLATGVLKFNWQYKAMQDLYNDMKRLYEEEKELQRRNTTAIESIAVSVKHYGSIGKNLEKVLGVLQARHDISISEDEERP